ncbi:hypothetical protein DNTS_004423 [Danionella cerebrum]|uniref:GRAM domain-containing protein n=1 Tax=Danionella cerebrum TaxID=2873325 RepID=A0A553NHA4_9TELE|nr:hypothetical protein DNTS_004423 [Danionella translucida]
MEKPSVCEDPEVSPLSSDGVSLRPNAEDEDEGNKTRSDAVASLDDAEVTERRRKPELVRSKTFDPSLFVSVQSDSESKCERRKLQSCQFPRTNSQYHKVFKEISEDEQLRQSYTCALQKDILYQGRMFVSQNWICFHSRVFGKDTKIAIPVSSVTVIKKTKTAILLPNALLVCTASQRHVFVSFLSRDATYKVLMSVCAHLLEKSPGITQMGSQSVSRGCHRLHHLHPGSLTSKRSQAFTEAAEALDPLQKPETDGSKHTTRSGSVDLGLKTLRPDSLSLNTLVLIYLSLVCVLLCSSCYMAFKILSLEEQISSLQEFPHKRDDHQSLFSGDSAEVCSLLSASLLKLEKIHTTLQRLMEAVTD